MNNKGFTLVELLLTISIISIVFVILTININNTFGLSDEKSYEIMKKSIITQVSQYIYECDNDLIYCANDYVWNELADVKKTSFNLDVMKKYEYLSEKEYINPITDKEINDCMIITVTKDEYSTIDVKLDDSKCLK